MARSSRRESCGRSDELRVANAYFKGADQEIVRLQRAGRRGRPGCRWELQGPNRDGVSPDVL
jgi:hypothetical protein